MNVEAFLAAARAREPSIKLSVKRWLEVDRLRGKRSIELREASVSHSDSFRFRTFFQQKRGLA